MNKEIDLFERAGGRNPCLELPLDVREIVSYLRTYCRGKSRAMPAREIARNLGYAGSYPDRKLRQLINDYYDKLPVMIIGLGNGFYVSEDPEDLTHKHRELYARLRSIAVLISGFKKTARRLGFEKNGSGASVEYHNSAS